MATLHLPDNSILIWYWYYMCGQINILLLVVEVVVPVVIFIIIIIIYYCLGHSFTSETFFVFFLIVNKVLTMFQTSPSGFPPSLPPSIVSGNSVSSPPSLLRKVTQLGPDMSYGGLQNKITNINRNSSLYKICQAINLMCMMAKAVSWHFTYSDLT